MASSAARLSLFLLLTLLSSLHTHARDSQFFNKIPSTTNNVVVPNNNEALSNQQEQQDPNFLPDTENSYGLYGHETGQNPPSTVAATTTTTPDNTEFKQPDHKYLPKNYNPVAYVTQPENVEENTPFTEERSFTTDNSNNNNNNQQQEGVAEEEAEFRSYSTTANNNNYYYNGGDSFNSQPQGESNGAVKHGGAKSFQPQGMSDTRLMASGKYHYDINTGRYSSNHPYETLRAQNDFNSRNFYQNNANEFSNRNFYQNNANEFNSRNNANEFNSRNFNGNNANEFNSRGYNGNNVDEFNNRNFYSNNANDFNAEEFQNEENLP